MIGPENVTPSWRQQEVGDCQGAFGGSGDDHLSCYILRTPVLEQAASGRGRWTM